MVIDIHTHIFSSLEDSFPKGWVEELYESKVRSFGEKAAEEWKSSYDGSAETLIREMDEAGVDKSVVLPLDFGIMCREEAKKSIWEINEYAAESQSNYPDRIIGFVGVDPLRKEAIEVLKKGIYEWKLKGVKVYPTHFRVTDAEVQPFWHEISELEVPVLVHQGADPLPFVIKYGNPADLDTLTQRYPKLRIVAAHCASGYEDVLIAMLRYKEDIIYTDIALLQGYEWAKSPWHFTFRMRYLMDKFPRSILMGSDWPFMKKKPAPSHKEWFDVIRNLEIPKQILDSGIKITNFTEEEKALILGENSKKLLGIN